MAAKASKFNNLAGLGAEEVHTSARCLKHHAQTFLRRIGLYQRLKSSFVYDLYWRLAGPHLLNDRAKEVEFYKNTLQGFREGYVIFDIGANEGHKTDIFLRLGAKVVAVDPDKSNQEVLRQKFLKHRLVPKKVNIEAKAVSEAAGFKTMWIETPGSAKNTLDPKWVEILRNDPGRFSHCFDFSSEMEVETTTLETLMAVYGVPFFIKIDVEGHEPSVLRGMKRPVPYLSFEVNLPEFRAEGLQCLNILGEIAENGEFNCVVDCRHGLMFKKWMPLREFIPVFNQCSETCIEIFWKTAVIG